MIWTHSASSAGPIDICHISDLDKLIPYKSCLLIYICLESQIHNADTIKHKMTAENLQKTQEIKRFIHIFKHLKKCPCIMCTI